MVVVRWWLWCLEGYERVGIMLMVRLKWFLVMFGDGKKVVVGRWLWWE